MRFKFEHTKERELSEIIYANECLGKSVEKIINFGQLLVNNMKK